MAHHAIDSELCAIMSDGELMEWVDEIVEQARQLEAYLVDQEGMERATIIYMRCRQTETLLAEYAMLRARLTRSAMNLVRRISRESRWLTPLTPHQDVCIDEASPIEVAQSVPYADAWLAALARNAG